MKTSIDTQTHSDCKLVTKPALAQRYTVSPRTIDNWMKNRVLPFIKIGKKFIRFDPDKCDAALARFTVNPEAKRPARARALNSRHDAARRTAQQKAKAA